MGEKRQSLTAANGGLIKTIERKNNQENFKLITNLFKLC